MERQEGKNSSVSSEFLMDVLRELKPRETALLKNPFRFLPSYLISAVLLLRYFICDILPLDSGSSISKCVNTLTSTTEMRQAAKCREGRTNYSL